VEESDDPGYVLSHTRKEQGEARRWQPKDQQQRAGVDMLLRVTYYARILPFGPVSGPTMFCSEIVFLWLLFRVFVQEISLTLEVGLIRKSR